MAAPPYKYRYDHSGSESSSGSGRLLKTLSTMPPRILISLFPKKITINPRMIKKIPKAINTWVPSPFQETVSNGKVCVAKLHIIRVSLTQGANVGFAAVNSRLPMTSLGRVEPVTSAATANAYSRPVSATRHSQLQGSSYSDSTDQSASTRQSIVNEVDTGADQGNWCYPV